MDNSITRFNWIDSFKGIAILGIVVIHAGGANLSGVAGKFGSAGHFGVQIFFMISAFLVWNSLDNHRISYPEWIKKRLKRLMPSYYLAYFVALIVTFFMGIRYSFLDILVHVLGIWGLFPQYNNTILAEWFLGALLIFTFVAPLVYRIVNNLEKSVVFFLCCIVITYISMIIMRSIWKNSLDDYNIGAYIGNTSVWHQLPTLSLGIVLYYIIKHIDSYRNNKTIDLKYRFTLSCALFVISLMLLLGEIIGKNYLVGFDPYVRFTIGSIILATSQHIHPSVVVVNRFFALFGRYSYPIYLYHYTIIKIINKIYTEGVKMLFIKVIAGIFIPLIFVLLCDKMIMTVNMLEKSVDEKKY